MKNIKLKKTFKENRECWLLQEFYKALKKTSSLEIEVECGEEGSGDGKLIINNSKTEVQVVTGEKTLYEKSALSKNIKKVVVYDVEPVEWIKDALKLKIAKNYANEKELIILIEFSDLRAINRKYLLSRLTGKEITILVEHFKEVYIMTPSDNSSFLTRSKSLAEPILVKL